MLREFPCFRGLQKLGTCTSPYIRDASSLGFASRRRGKYRCLRVGGGWIRQRSEWLLKWCGSASKHLSHTCRWRTRSTPGRPHTILCRKSVRSAPSGTWTESTFWPSLSQRFPNSPCSPTSVKVAYSLCYLRSSWILLRTFWLRFFCFVWLLPCPTTRVLLFFRTGIFSSHRVGRSLLLRRCKYRNLTCNCRRCCRSFAPLFRDSTSKCLFWRSRKHHTSGWRCPGIL